jgi:PqqD family protein of HPr-rel-A system
MNPVARRSDVIVQQVGGDVVVYDSVAGTAHALNALAASAYRNADGSRDLEALAAAVSSDLGVESDAGTIEEALVELARVDLVAFAGAGRRRQSMGRRDALRRIGLAATLPFVTSLVVPEPVFAQSKPRKGGPKDPKPPKPPKPPKK